MSKRLLAHPKVTVLWNTVPLEAKGDGDLLQSIEIKDTKTGETKDLPVNGLFYAIGESQGAHKGWSGRDADILAWHDFWAGHEPATALVRGQVDTDEDGYIITQPGTSLTSVKGVFAAGDVQDKKYRQVSALFNSPVRASPA